MPQCGDTDLHLVTGLYEAAARRGVSRQNTGTRPISSNVASAIPRQFSGAGIQRPSSPLARPPHTLPRPDKDFPGDGWAVSPEEKAQFDRIYASVDTANRGFITGEQAVGFFSNSKLPEEALAQIWDLADIVRVLRPLYCPFHTVLPAARYILGGLTREFDL